MAFLTGIGKMILGFLFEKLWGMAAAAIATFRKKKQDDATNTENAKKLEEAQKGGDDEVEARASENLLNGDRG